MINDVLTAMWKERRTLFHDQITPLIKEINSTQLLLLCVVVLAVVDVGLHLAALARFQRSRLYLD